MRDASEWRMYLNNNEQKKVISIVNICLTLKRHVKTVFIRILWKTWLCVPRDYQHSNGATEFNIVARVTFD